MEEIKIKIPHEIEFIKEVPDIEWSILASKLIRSKLDKIARMQKIVSKSKLTEKDVGEFSDKINEALSKRYLKG
ncbi:MAG: hypothetical protein WDZ69_01810 [Candidatus Pacearchaeota archaeon]